MNVEMIPMRINPRLSQTPRARSGLLRLSLRRKAGEADAGTPGRRLLLEFGVTVPDNTPALQVQGGAP